MQEILDQLEAKREAARMGGGERRIKAQHERGKLTARERIDLLLDEGTFEEIDMFVAHRASTSAMAEQRVPGDGVVTGHGHDQRPARVRLLAGLHRVRRLALGGATREKICKIMDLAMQVGRP